MVLPKFENSGNKYKKVPTQPAFTCSKLTIKTPERRHFGVINFEHVNADWEVQCQGIKVS